MKYTEFGKTGIEVSKMCLGTWGIGGAGWDNYSDEPYGCNQSSFRLWY